MSLIHDALKRAERERGQPPGVVVPSETAGGEPARERGPVWPWLVAVTLIPAAALGGWAAWNGSVFDTAVESEPVLAERTPDGSPERAERSGDAGSANDAGSAVDAGRANDASPASDEASGESRHLASSQVESSEADSVGDPDDAGQDEMRSHSGQGSDEPRSQDERPASSADDDERSDSREGERPGDDAPGAMDEGDDPSRGQERATGEAEPASAEPKDDPDTSRDEKPDESGEPASPSDAEAEPERAEEAKPDEQTSEAHARQAESSLAEAEKDAKSDDGADGSARAESRAVMIDLRARHEAWRSALAEGDMAKSKKELAEVQKALPPDHLMRLRMEGWTAYRQGELDQAADRYRRVTERRPGDVESALNLASIYLSLEKPSRARAAIAEARRHSPESEALRQAQRRIGS